jgi:hypothetical protein
MQTLPALGSLLSRELPACIVVPISSPAIRQQVAGTDQAMLLADVIAAIVISRFNGRSLAELCAMGGITLDDFSQSVAYREIFGQGRQGVPIRALPPKRLAAAAG